MDYLHFRQIFCWQNASGSFARVYRRKDDSLGRSFFKAGHPGLSDIIGIMPDGRFLAIEVKAEKGRVAPHQQEFIDSINARGGVAFVARSVHEVEEALPRKNS